MEGKYLQIILSILIPVIMLLGSINFLSISNTFYNKEIEKGSVIDQNYVNAETATEISLEVISYFKGDGELTEELVGVNAKAHMEDVKNLRDISIYIFYISLVVVLISIMMLFLIQKQLRITKALIYGSTITLLINTLLVVASQLFFNSLWIKFHSIIFSNNLWELNPSQNSLVAVFSHQFFIDFITMAVIITSVCSFVLLITGIYFKKIFSEVNEKIPKKVKPLKLDKPDGFQW